MPGALIATCFPSMAPKQWLVPSVMKVVCDLQPSVRGSGAGEQLLFIDLDDCICDLWNEDRDGVVSDFETILKGLVTVPSCQVAEGDSQFESCRNGLSPVGIFFSDEWFNLVQTSGKNSGSSISCSYWPKSGLLAHLREGKLQLI